MSSEVVIEIPNVGLSVGDVTAAAFAVVGAGLVGFGLVAQAVQRAVESLRDEMQRAKDAEREKLDAERQSFLRDYQRRRTDLERAEMNLKGLDRVWMAEEDLRRESLQAQLWQIEQRVQVSASSAARAKLLRTIEDYRERLGTLQEEPEASLRRLMKEVENEEAQKPESPLPDRVALLRKQLDEDPLFQRPELVMTAQSIRKALSEAESHSRREPRMWTQAIEGLEDRAVRARKDYLRKLKQWTDKGREFECDLAHSRAALSRIAQDAENRELFRQAAELQNELATIEADVSFPELPDLGGFKRRVGLLETELARSRARAAAGAAMAQQARAALERMGYQVTLLSSAPENTGRERWLIPIARGIGARLTLSHDCKLRAEMVRMTRPGSPPPPLDANLARTVEERICALTLSFQETLKAEGVPVEEHVRRHIEPAEWPLVESDHPLADADEEHASLRSAQRHRERR